MDVSIIVPVHRNADTLRELRARLSAALAPTVRHLEWIFVDDACPEGSGEVLRELAREDPRVGVVSLAANVGQHRAVLVGLAHAHHDTLVVVDADLQDPPEAVPRLLAELADGVYAVFGGRRGVYQSVTRMATSRMFKWVLHAATRGHLPADAGLFMAMTRTMADRVVGTAGTEPYVPALVARTGLRTASVSVERAPRSHGRSSYTATARVATALRALRGAVGARPRREGTPAVVRELMGEPFRGGCARPAEGSAP